MCGCVAKTMERSSVDGGVCMTDFLRLKVGCDCTGVMLMCMDHLIERQVL